MINYVEEYVSQWGYHLWCDGYDGKDQTFLYALLAPPAEHLGDNTVMLVAHADTVGDSNHIRLYQEWDCDYSEANEVIYSCGSCCLDDRTGIAIIIDVVEQLVEKGYYPFILITGEEECGCVGAICLVEDYPELEYLVPGNKISCFIEVDRKGSDQVVFYEFSNPEFEKLFEKHYKKDKSIAWTDVVILGPMWNYAIANVSAGYYGEHTQMEFAPVAGVQLCTQRLYLTLLDIYKLAPEQYHYNGSMKTACSLLMAYQSPPLPLFETGNS